MTIPSIIPVSNPPPQFGSGRNIVKIPTLHILCAWYTHTYKHTHTQVLYIYIINILYLMPYLCDNIIFYILILIFITDSETGTAESDEGDDEIFDGHEEYVYPPQMCTQDVDSLNNQLETALSTIKYIYNSYIYIYIYTYLYLLYMKICKQYMMSYITNYYSYIR